MKTKRVTVVPYDEAWEAAFEVIKNEIEAVIGDMILGIEHIGSTSVKMLSVTFVDSYSSTSKTSERIALKVSRGLSAIVQKQKSQSIGFPG